MASFLLIILAYLIGSIPFGYIIAKFKGIDIKKVGSGNIGGTNVGRALGKKYAILVIFLDLLKALSITYLSYHLFGYSWQTAFVGLAVIAGHIFSIFLGFKGGKGVGPLIGVGIVFANPVYFIFFVLLWAILVKTIKLMSLTNLIIALGLPIYFIFFKYSLIYLIISFGIAGLIFWAHRENISRLINGNERTL